MPLVMPESQGIPLKTDAYSLQHKADVDAHITQLEQEAQGLRRKIEAPLDYVGIKERLPARRTRKNQFCEG